MPQARDEAGNIWEVDGQGNPVRLLQAGSTAPQPIAPNPMKVRDANAGYNSTVTNTQGKVLDNTVTAATIPAVINKTKAEAVTAEQGTRLNALGDKQFSDALGQFNEAMLIQRQLGDLRRSFNAGPGSTSGWSGLQDLVPTFFSEANQNFNEAANRMRPSAKGGTGTTGGENNTATEMRMNLGSYIPAAWQFDSTIESKFKSMNDLSDRALKESIQRLGGVPDAMGNIHPLGSPEAQQVLDQYSALVAQAQPKEAPPIMGGSASPIPGPIGGGISGMGYRGAPMAPASGTLLGPAQRKEYDWEEQAYFESMLRGGASLEQMNAEAQVRGRAPFDAGQYERARAWLKKYPNEKSNLVPPEFKLVDQSGFERAVQGIPGAVAIGAANAGSGGALELVAPEGVNMSREAHPWASMAGEVGGVIGNQTAAMKLTPLGRISNPVARNMAYDTAYSGTRGAAANPENPGVGAITGTGLGMLGSVGGQGAASVIGRGFSGVRSSPSVQWLRDRGVTPTLGQIMRGRASDNGGRSFVAGLEDAISNTPGAGSMVNAARNRALADANTAIYREVGGPQINGVGQEALTGINAAKNAAYNDALRGVSIPKNDPRLIAQMNAVNPGRAAAVSEFGDFLDGKLNPVLNDGRPNISGARLQEAMRLLGKEGRKYGKAASGTPYYSDVADAIKQTENAIVSAATRNAPGAIPKLKAANALNRNLSILDDAAERGLANPGASSELFTAAQLRQSMLANANKYGKRGLLSFGKSPLAQGQKAMEAVIPNEIPPTGVNMAPALAGLGAVTAGVNEGTGFDSSILRVLAGMAMLSAPYTRTGAKVAAKALLDRPQSVANFGSSIRKAKGLFGSATIPLLLESNK